MRSPIVLPWLVPTRVSRVLTGPEYVASTSDVVVHSSRVNRTPTLFSNTILRTMIVPRRTGGRAGGRTTDSRCTFAYGEGLEAGMVEQVAISERAEEPGEGKAF